MVADSLARWHVDHANYAVLLDILEEQVATFVEGENPNYALMLDIVSYLRDAPDRYHHPHEDVLLARLAVREPALSLPINRLLQEHRVIAAAGEELLTRLNDVVAGAVLTRSSVEAAAALYLAYYRHHLASQEREILPRATKLLTQEDWGLVASAAPDVPDPLFVASPGERYRELREAIARRVAAAGHALGATPGRSQDSAPPSEGLTRGGGPGGAQNE
jgi:hemerythrin-like domain-containing protein